MSDFKDILFRAMSEGKILDSCHDDTRMYDFGLYTDLCGMSIEDAMKVQMGCGCGSGTGTGGGNTNTGSTEPQKVDNVARFNVVSSGDDNKLTITLSKVPEEPIFITYNLTTKDVDEEGNVSTKTQQETAVIPAGVSMYQSELPLTSKYGTISNVSFAPSSLYNLSSNSLLSNGNFSVNFQGAGSLTDYVGSAVVAPEGKPEIGQNFEGWQVGDEIIPAGDKVKIPEGGASIKPIYKPILYSITYNGIAIKNDAKYQDKIFDIVNAEDKNIPEGYDFVKWVDEDGKEINANYSMPAKDIVVKAVHKIKVFTITFVNDDKTISTQTVEWNKMPVEPINVSKEEDAQYKYEFKGWNAEIVAAKEDKTYEAVYDKITKQYTATFKNTDGSVITSYTIDYGTIISYKEANPTKESTAQYHFEFNGWDKPFAEITEDIIYTAEYREVLRSYDITFVTDKAEENKVVTVNYGERPDYDGVPTKDEDVQYTYEFKAWEPDVVSVTGEATYTATFKETLRKYAVIFKNEDGTELQNTEFDYGTMPVYSGETPVKTEDDTYTYEFKGWNKEVAAVDGTEQVYIAEFVPIFKNYSVTFVVSGETVFKKTDYHFGDVIEYPESPETVVTPKYTYTFTGWDNENSTVNGNMTFKAMFDSVVNKYNVVFKNWDDDALQVTEVEYDAMPVYSGATPVKDEDETFTYVFSSWTPEIVTVTGDAEYVAVFGGIYKEYNVKFTVDGKTISENTYHYNDAVVLPDTPTKESDDEYNYTFSAWTPEVVAVNGDAEYRADFNKTKVEYTIAFSVDGEPWGESIKLAWGENIDVASFAEPVKEKEVDGITYRFSGWKLPETVVDGVMPKADIEIIGEYVEKQEAKTIYYGIMLKSDYDSGNYENIIEQNNIDIDSMPEYFQVTIPASDEYIAIDDAINEADDNEDEEALEIAEAAMAQYKAEKQLSIVFTIPANKTITSFKVGTKAAAEMVGKLVITEDELNGSDYKVVSYSNNMFGTRTAQPRKIYITIE